MLKYGKPRTLSKSTRLAAALASAIMMFFPITIGYYMLRFNLWIGSPAVVLLAVYTVISVGVSAIIAFLAYKLVVYIGSRVRG